MNETQPEELDAKALLKLRRLPTGAEVLPQGWMHFRVWAPKRQRVGVEFEDSSISGFDLQAEGDGYFSGTSPQNCPACRYAYKLDNDQMRYPDPVSRYQPDGPHKWSQVVDPREFAWTDDNWLGRPADEMILYEMHFGTFTTEGTYAAAKDKLSHLNDLGITCIEVMPLAEYNGRWNWGYDGVQLFAPSHNYGTPDQLRDFIDAAHALGICVILDLVYNHLGPEGNYIGQFTDTFFTTIHHTDWGSAINFDGEGSAGVREHYLSNAKYWIDEYHFDGYRFDATQNIYDDSESHILAEITGVSRAAGGKRTVYLINENEPQHTKLVRPVDKGGYGMDALWNDDWHHTGMVALTGRSEAYYTDYAGRPQEFISAAKFGYLYQGQYYRWQKHRRGTPGLDLPPYAFVNYVQNHDQVANFGRGFRVDRLSSEALLRAITTLLILSPQSPMLFQGQEWLATSDFTYFADHGPELGKLIRAGRVKELSQHPSQVDSLMIDDMPDPSEPNTFHKCKLDWDEIQKRPYSRVLQMHKDLIALRKSDPVLRRSQRLKCVDGAVVGRDAFVLRFFGEHDDDRLLVVNFMTDAHLSIVPEPLLAPPYGKRWETLFSSENPLYGGHGSTVLESHDQNWALPGENWRIPGRSATLLKPRPE